MALPPDPFGRARLPHDFSREDRVRLLGEAARDLLAGESPEPAALVFLAGGLTAWLDRGGDLLRDYWKVKAPPGSHRTPSQLWASSRGATAPAEPETITASDQPPERDDA